MSAPSRRSSRRTSKLRSGFTLGELAVVSAILAGLAIAIITYVSSTSQTVNTEVAATVDELRTGVDIGQLRAGAGGYGTPGEVEGVSLSYGSPLVFDPQQVSQSYLPSVSGGELGGTLAFSVAAGSLPAGVTLDAVSGVIAFDRAEMARSLVTETGVAFDLGEASGALPSPGANAGVRAVAVQSDGKIVIGGAFTTVDGTTRNRIARLNADGTLDTDFNPSTSTVNAVAIQSDGKIVIGGTFTSVNGTTRNRIARLNADGTLDTDFNPSTSTVNAVAIQSDGKIVIGGTFTSVNGTTRNRIARLNADGTLDTDFNPGTGANNTVWTVAVQPDGKIVIGGAFTTVDGTTRNRIARLNADGTLDTSFGNGLAGASSTVRAVAVQSDGKVVIGGDFTSVNGITINRVARLNADGSLDATFDPGTGASSTVNVLAVQSDGKVVIGGFFTTVNGTARNQIARLNADGTLDTSFGNGLAGAGDTVQAVAVQSDGKIVIGGGFTTVNGVSRERIARLNADGTLDTSFGNGLAGAGSGVEAVAVQSDGKIVIGGWFTTVNGVSRNRIARLNADGTLDTSFGDGLAGANNTVYAVAVQSDGKIVIGGAFTTVDGTTRNRIARLNADGTLDTSFGNGLAGAGSGVEAVAVQSDGKIVIGGWFTTVNGVSRNRIARLNADGTLDTSFGDGLAGANNTVYAVAIQSDGKIVIGGNFTSVNGTTINRVARLNADGTLDTGFNPGTGANFPVWTVAIQSDGKIVIGGNFTSVNGTTINRVARLNADGTLDTDFDPGTGANNTVNAVAIQSDGKVVIGGDFTSVNGITINRVARLNADGSLDTGFNPGDGASSTVRAVAVQSDGKIVIGGAFTSVDGTTRNRIARLSEQYTGIPFTVTVEAENQFGWRVSSGPMIFNQAN
jgi:uncharacterized delta-60 repeat protein